MRDTRKPSRNWTARLAGAALAAALASPASAQELVRRLFFPHIDGQGETATLVAESDAVYLFVFWISALFFVLLMVLTAYWSVKYRRRPGVPQQRSRSHNLALELTWSGVPLLLYALMFAWGFVVYMKMQVTPAGAELVSVTAKKWNWTWEYSNGGSSLETVRLADMESPVYMIPVGRPVKLLMQSQDVIHALYVPAFRKKIDVQPNRFTTLWFQAERPGDYQMFCAEYCGDQHSQMMALIKARPEAEYRQWLAELVNIDRFTLAELGPKLYISKGCVSCHSTDGTAGTGPTWKDIWGKTEQTNLGPVTVDENYVRESILNPGAKITQGFSNQMPTFQGQLKPRELTALVWYIMSLSESGKSQADELNEQDKKELEQKQGAPAGDAPAGSQASAS